MAVLEPPVFNRMTITPEVTSVVETQAAGDAILGDLAVVERIFSERWKSAIDRFIEWGSSPSHIDEDDLESPSRDACANARRLAAVLQDQDYLPPDRVVPTGDGGIVLERKRDRDAFVFEVAADGMIEYFAFHDSRLISRCEIDVH